MRFFIFIKSFIVIFAFNGAWANTQALPMDQRPEALAFVKSGIKAGASHKPAQEKLSAWLTENNLDLKEGKEALLKEAMSQGNFEMARLLIDLENKREEKLKLLDIYLAENSLDSKESKEALFFLAVGEGDAEIARLLVSLGVEVNPRNERGQTPFYMISSGKDASRMVPFLVGFGADIRLVDNVGDTPLHHIARNGDFKIAKLLIAHGAEVHTANNQGQTALHLAIIEINNGVLFNQKSEEEIKDLIKTAALLMAHGARLGDQDDFRQTPRDLIGQIKNLEIKNLLHHISGQGDLAQTLRDKILNDNLSLENMRTACQTAIRDALSSHLFDFERALKNARGRGI